MEKVGALIGRLQQQYSQQADDAALLNTVLLLATELQSNRGKETTAGKVSVIMPYKPFDTATNESSIADESTNLPAVESEVADTVARTDAEEEPAIEQLPLPETTEPEPAQIVAVNTLAEEKYIDEMEEIPTLAQQQPKVVYELNDTAQPEEQSINDKLKQQAKELGSKLQSEPVKDLRKAIGVNDKYLFIRELFRNDEAAYERSIKTINSFNILPEAEYWIQREMKYKQGWDDSNPTVQIFYQLVKRRFS